MKNFFDGKLISCDFGVNSIMKFGVLIFKSA